MFGGVRQFSAIIEQQLVLITGQSDVVEEEEDEPHVGISVRMVTPTFIPMGHSQVRIEFHGTGFRPESDVLCSFDYEHESLLSNAAYHSASLLSCQFRYPTSHSEQVQYTAQATQSRTVVLRAIDLSADV